MYTSLFSPADKNAMSATASDEVIPNNDSSSALWLKSLQ